MIMDELLNLSEHSLGTQDNEIQLRDCVRLE